MTHYFKRSNQLLFILALRTSFKGERLETDMPSTRNVLDPFFFCVKCWTKVSLKR